jgi:proteic killer suppression protein
LTGEDTEHCPQGPEAALHGRQLETAAAETVDKLHKMLAFLQDMQSANELRTISVWKAHQLTGDRKGVWSLHVTRNWRLTFWIDDENEISDLNLEDYH